MLLVLVLLAHDSMVLRSGGHHQGVRERGRGNGPALRRYAGRGGIVGPGVELPERVEVLSDVACEVWEAVAEDGWSASAASDTLATVDALVDALARIGPQFAGVLAPALAATAAARALLANSEDGREVTGLRSAPRAVAGPAPTGRHTVPEFWINRNMVVAEQLWWGEQEGRGGPLADMFAALPPALWRRRSSGAPAARSGTRCWRTWRAATPTYAEQRAGGRRARAGRRRRPRLAWGGGHRPRPAPLI
ncbi:hypothetical protein [Streptomyces sp. NPDC056061]|uniref:hypothetical protein n=1 Tax=Streptomyces sp. NPDC056061 TaxID=3345700 RepID=UPI0035E0F230